MKEKKGTLTPIKILIAVLVLALVASIMTNGFSFANNSVPNAISQEIAAKKAVDFINSELLGGQGTATVKSVSEKYGMYNIVLDIDGQEYDSYITKDGSVLFPQSMELTASRTPTVTTPTTPTTLADLPKSDKPVVELFVMSHCPYGTQTEKGIIPAAELLGDKIDFSIKFVNYAMHGEVEVTEQLGQYCIETEQGDKYLTYLKCFLEAGDTDTCLIEAGIDTAALETCKTAADAEFSVTENLNSGDKYPKFLIHNTENLAYGVRGSPTLVVNGQQVSTARDSASLLANICSAFNTQPVECSETLSSEPPSTGFGYGTTGSNTASSCG